MALSGGDARDMVAVAEISLPTRPRLHPWVTVVELGDDRLELRSEEGAFTLRGPFFIELFSALRPHLDGRRTIEELASAAGPDHDTASIGYLLKALRAHGLIGSGAPADNDAMAGLERQVPVFARFTDNTAAVIEQIRGARIALVGASELCERAVRALGEAGAAHTVELGSDPGAISTGVAGAAAGAGREKPLELVVACQDVVDHEFFDRVDRACIERGARWLRVAVEGVRATLGPTFVPGATACYRCLLSRARSHTDADGFDAYLERRRLDGPLDVGALPAMLDLATAQLALEVVRLVTGFTPPVTLGRAWSLDLKSPAAAAHDVLRVPRCQRCGRHPPRRPWAAEPEGR